MQDIIAIVLGEFGCRSDVACGGPGEEVDEMLVALIDERCDRPTGDIVEAAALEGKTFQGEILDRRGKIKPSIEPWFDRVLISREDIFEMTGLQGPNMTGDDLFREALLSGG
jgi:hypothetical protein